MFLYFNSKRKDNKIVTFSETHTHDILYLNSIGIPKQNKQNIFRQNCFSFIFGYERRTRLIKKITHNDILYFNNTGIPKQYKTQTFKQTKKHSKDQKRNNAMCIIFSNKIKIVYFCNFDFVWKQLFDQG